MQKPKFYISALCIVVLTVSIVLVLAIPLSIFLPRAIFLNSLKDISNESDRIPAHVIFGVVHNENEKVDVDTLCWKQTNGRDSEEIFCIANGKAYFVYTVSKPSHTWVIASVNLETKVLQEHCRFTDVKGIYTADPYSPYSQRNGYYYNGQIVLSDFESVFVYDIARDETDIYAYATYVFPQQTIYGECSAEHTITLHIGDSSRTFTMTEMAQASDGIAAIYAFKDKTIWSGHSYFPMFLGQNHIQVIGDRIYTMEPVLNYSGEPYAVILEYSQDRETWLYVSMCFAGDTIHKKCYVIPVTGDGSKPLKK